MGSVSPMSNSPLTLKYDVTRNWGDALAPQLLTWLSGTKPELVPLREACDRPNLLTVGSVLRMVDENTTVWGAGFISRDDGLGLTHWDAGASAVVARPRAVRAVRGPLTREKLLAMGIPCPQVYGDPALLLPRFVPPASRTRFELGVVPHYTDRHDPALAELRRDPKVKVIDVRVGRLGHWLGRPDLMAFARAVSACEKIVSSSLHGLVVAESYGVPSQRLRLGDGLIGGDFKFEDFFASVYREAVAPLQLGHAFTRRKILDAFRGGTGRFDPDPLLEACPFSGVG